MSASRSRSHQPSAQATQTAPHITEMKCGTGTCGQGLGVTLLSSFLSCPGSFFSQNCMQALHSAPTDGRRPQLSHCDPSPPTPVPGPPSPDRHPRWGPWVGSSDEPLTAPNERRPNFSMLPKPFHPSTPSHHHHTEAPLASAAALTMRPPGGPEGLIPLGRPLGRLNHSQ